ncbi:acetyltransferase [Brevundimonas sp. UBA5936]|jgi:putative acetyltransferase|uniref:acetyltransferase n=1 Tax=Brevundimonas sp. UBA5936 TaxID=1946133 RepID=UPI0025C2F64F|nr:acetyltransferase [Brevundimonas sp. UBA5936]
MRYLIRPSTPADTDRLVNIWRGAVDATHDFLDPDDRQTIETEVRAFFPTATFEVAVDGQDFPVGFMLLDDTHLEALFINPDRRGEGIGTLLMQSAMRARETLTVDVNEQNTQALGFYERLGFTVTGRSAVDGQGRPYPLLHLRLAKPVG